MSKIYYFNPEKWTPEKIGEKLGLEVMSEPGSYEQFLLEGKPVGYVMRPGGRDAEDLQLGAISLQDDIVDPEKLEIIRA